jgi:hypothetical protein
MRNLLIPSSYQIQVEYNKKYIQEQRYLIKTENIINNEILNFKHSDGRIYASDKDQTNNYLAITVSPYHPKFEEQIEDGIKDVVFAFLNKNYITISSCEGHFKSNNTAHVKLAFPFLEDRNYIIEKLKNIPFVTFKLSDKSANVEEYKDSNGINRIKKLKDSKYSCVNEAENINKLFFKKYKKYCFLDIRFFEYKYAYFVWPYYQIFNPLIPISNLFINYLKNKYEKQVKNLIINIINSKEFLVYDK